MPVKRTLSISSSYNMNKTHKMSCQIQIIKLSFNRYNTRKDKYGFKRNLKIYQANKIQLSSKLDKLAKTPSGRQRQIQVNQTWYYKEKIKENLSSDEGQAIYRRRKYDVEPVFLSYEEGFWCAKNNLRGQKSVENDIGLVLMSMNLVK